MAGEDVARVVSALRELPFALRQISESDFASGNDDRARRVARDAFHALAPFDEPAWAPSRDADADDPPARASARLLVAFLAVVKYPPARDDAGALARAFAPDAADAGDDAAGDAAGDALARALRWVVDHREKCATRAHVAHHIADVPGLPVEMRGAPEMAEALDAQDRARRAFVAAHKKYERSRSRGAPSSELENPRGSLDAASLTRAVADLENEKETLTKRIEAVERKIETRVGGGDGDGKAVAALAAAAREETRAESETRRAATSARERAEAADARRRRAAARLRDTLASLGDGASPLATLERARAETERARVETSETLPDLLREKRRRERALAEASDARNLDETELRERAGEVNALTASVEEDERFVERKERERDGGDPAARQQASLAKSVRAKRDAAVSARDRLAARAKRAEDEREALESSGEEKETNDRTRSDTRVGFGETETNPVAETIVTSSVPRSSKRREYETLKPRLDAANAESATLARTAAILRDQMAGARSRATGARADGEAQRVQKHGASSGPPPMASLAPRVAELRERRAAFAALEQTHEERRRAFDKDVRAHRSGYERLERETAALKNRVRGDETKFHAFSVERSVAAALEERAVGTRGDKLVTAHEGFLRDAETEAERSLRELDSNDDGENGRADALTREQMGALLDARALIETRLRVARAEAASAGFGGEKRLGGTRDGANVLSM